MGSLLVVPADPVPDLSPGVVEILKQMLSHALLLQAPEEAFDHAVLLRGIGGDELLAEMVVPESRPEPATLEDESVVTPRNGGVPLGTQGAEAGDTGFFQSPLRFLGSPPEGELKAHDLSVVAVDDGGQVSPAVIDCHDREIMGFEFSLRGRAKEAERALEEACIARFGTNVSVTHTLHSRTERHDRALLPELEGGVRVAASVSGLRPRPARDPGLDPLVQRGTPPSESRLPETG